jgi:hypothetical protein
MEFQGAGRGVKPKLAVVDTRMITDPSGHLRRLFGELAAFRVITELATVDLAAAGEGKQEPARPTQTAAPADASPEPSRVLPGPIPPAWMTRQDAASPPGG